MAVLECRGPDAHGEVHHSRVSAGHRRLAVIGLGEAGHQPYASRDGHDLLVFNGEIYNYRELASTLGIDAHSDTHVLHHILRTGRVELVSSLRGMFAFVYWRSEPEVIIAGRDHFGIKPLYVMADSDGSLSFASVVAALTPLAASPTADPLALTGFLATGYFPDGESAFDSIAKCAPGTLTTWRRGTSGWVPSTTHLGLPQLDPMSADTAISDSVRAHLVSDVPVGVLMSGGVDSTLIAAVAAKEVDDLRTFSLVNPDSPSIDEGAYARWNAQIIGSRHTEVPFDPAGCLPAITAIIRTSGEPFSDAAGAALATLCERVSSDMKVVLAGEGADELFGGYVRHDAMRLREGRRSRRLVRALGRIARGQDAYRRRPPSNRVRSMACWSEDDDFLAYGYLMSAEWHAVVTAFPELGARALACRREAWHALSDLDRSLGLRSPHAFDLTQWLPNVFLEKSDRASMVHGVEVRLPFLDPAVARVASVQSATDSSKSPLREALLHLVPGVRLPPRKMGLSVDLRRLLSTPDFAETIQFTLHDDASVLRGIGLVDETPLALRATLNPTFAFRLGVLGLWQQEWLA